MSRSLLVLAPLLLLVLGGCGQESADDPIDVDGQERLPEGDFVAPALPTPFGTGDRVRATFRGDQVSFSATCNTMSGTAGVVDGGLEVDRLGGTEMGCPGAGHEQDEWLVGFLTGSPRIETLDVGFSLSSDGTTLRFLPPEAAPGPEVPLRGTRWLLTGIEHTEGDAVSMTGVGKVRAHLLIERGTVSLDTGCNTGGGHAKVVVDRLRLSRVAVTLRGCLDHRGEIERGVMSVLGDRWVDWSTSGRQLRLSSGDTALLYVAG